MAATVEIDESHGAGETLTHGISNSNFGSSDAANLVAANYPITPGNNSYEKWQKFHVSAMGGSSKIKTLKVWRTTALGGSAVHVTNAREAGYAGAAVYATPVATDSSVATQAMPTSEPTGANLGIGGSLAGEITVAGSSDYLVHQVQSDAGDIAGASTTMHYQYEEVA
jgi:hypothetical protein